MYIQRKGEELQSDKKKKKDSRRGLLVKVPAMIMTPMLKPFHNVQPTVRAHSCTKNDFPIFLIFGCIIVNTVLLTHLQISRSMILLPGLQFQIQGHCRFHYQWEPWGLERLDPEQQKEQTVEQMTALAESQLISWASTVHVFRKLLLLGR